MSTTRVLLPTNVRPLHYRIHFTPHFDSFTFDGVETVELKVNQPTDTVVLNALELNISSAKVVQGGSEQIATAIELDSHEETAALKFPSQLTPGDAVLHVQFTGTLNDKLSGFYRSQYVHNGETKYLATTQFEPVEARKAFPCWDEPAIKATFTVVITSKSSHTILGNMPPKTETVDEEKSLKTVEFDKTPIVSTYLIAFCVGDLESIETVTKEGIKFRVWTTPGKKEMGTFALDVGAKVISYFADYYDTPYPLPKQDMVAIPDFAAGAMENWGLITYRETALLCDTKIASVAAKARIAYVVAHELAHQWFGNLVTMEWWNNLWLNEGFATFVGTHAVAKFFPEWEVWTQFVSDYMFRALQVDSLRNSHPIEVDVDHARKIDEIFDAISYCKGASVIRMIENYLGEESFRKGLNIYLNKFKYSNSVTKDLWDALSVGSGKDVSQIMDTWVKKIGYPVINVSETEEVGVFKVSQRRYLAAGNPTDEENSTVWTINVGFASQGSSQIKYVDLKEREGVIKTGVTNKDDWVKFNAGQSGFYRVQYSPSLSLKLGEAIRNLSLPAGDRVGIQNDAFALSKAGDIPLSQALQIALNYVNEVDFTTWSDLSQNLGSVGTLLSGTPAEPLFNKFILNLYKKIGSLGWDPVPGEKDLNKILRAVVLGQLGDHGDQAVIDEAKKRFAAFIKDRSTLSSDLAGVVFKLVMRNGGETEYNQMLEIYKTATQPEERIRALRSLGLATTPELINRALEFALSDDTRIQDIIYPFYSCSSTHAGREATWSFVKNNWDRIDKKLTGSNMLFSRIISYTTQDFSSEEKAKDVEEFFKTHHAASTERTIQQSLESIRTNAQYLNRNISDVQSWLEKNQ
eukprot:TRINITY_DN11382_c0_g1_i1.p1 TRINITY_DN11382_c0_g1~~TRINITY_DN11382_c0_g1_i1.p1  ORF type:complete len:861 (-),score=234.44 TRINITY_DN11382_c0_g1_i1:165-2747(-)